MWTGVGKLGLGLVLEIWVLSDARLWDGSVDQRGTEGRVGLGLFADRY